MRKIQILLSLFIFVFSNTYANTVDKIDLIPYPNQIEYGKGNLILPFDMPIKINGISEKPIIDFLTKQLPFIQNKSVNWKKAQSISLEIVKNDNVKSDEWYQLLISKKGIAIKANSSKGLLYGISTLNQVLFQTMKNGHYQLPYLTIDDTPAYQYRGFMLDASRHMQSVQTVKAILDFMGRLKLNVFHWHLTDDNGWRIESRRYPQLNLVASYARNNSNHESNGYYSIEEIHDILNYAKQRNIKVIPEFDIPGHSWALLDAFPEYRCPHAPNSSAFCAGNSNSLQFIKLLFDEIIEIFQPQYIHIGGDEREKDLWNNCPLCKNEMTKLNIGNENDLQNYFLNEVAKHIHAKNIITIAWAENLETGIPENQIIQAWGEKDEAATAIKMGHKVIVSDHEECYLDYPVNAKDKETKPIWMPILTTEKLYDFDFIAQGITQEESKLVLGGECALWTEDVAEKQIYYQIKSRIEAHAERSWTKVKNKDVTRFMKSYQKLEPYFTENYIKNTN